MFSNNFFTRFKEHKQYLYVSVLIIAIFFIGSSLITSKITTVTENLIEDLLQGNLNSKENIVDFEFNQLNGYLTQAKQILENKEYSWQVKNERLSFIAEQANHNLAIRKSFLYNQISSLEGTEIPPSLQSELSRFSALTLVIKDTVLQQEQIHRKIIAQKGENNDYLIFAYDIDLISFWSYFSERYRGDGGYTVVTNANGICLLHPEPMYLGKKLTHYFNGTSISDIVNQKKGVAPIKNKAQSRFLGLEVLRYYNKVTLGTEELIVVVSFPVEIHLKETTQNIQDYFSWISFLAFLTFMLILIVSRLQLKKEYVENLRVVEEKEQLVYANEKYQKENAVLQLNQLKKKMHPHFLFNSLNSLHVLIDVNPDLSQQFVLKLAEVYRYLLEERVGNLISVKKEITFLEQYVFLQEIRFKNSLNVSITNKCSDKILQKQIPFLSLETLVENAIKHNEITKQNPLYIEVIITTKGIEVLNNYTPRNKKEQTSYHIGLTYLENTYLYYQIASFETEIANGKFKCFLPFINVK
ncbi:sensor histidine kinase [Ochrovirga pacifica]|uniref:sensor histidine kinase n=1 Tax=Ochrovirga pacifica TaxID=1042376 RepID=UPI0002557752|nr:sensor histidine kinase [Ochrovirga pacifica]